MDSEINLSLPAPLTTHNSVETELKGRGKSAYTIWVHTRTAHNRENSRLKFCIHCTATPPYSTSVSINMRGHLKSKHGIYIDRTPGPI